MNVVIALSALARPSGDLVAGIVIGAALGFLAGPFIRHLLAMREWAAASREARLTEALVERLPAGRAEHVERLPAGRAEHVEHLPAGQAEQDGRPNPEEDDGGLAYPRDRGVRWPTSH